MLNLSAETVQLVALFVVPGLVASWTYRLLVPAAEEDVGSTVLSSLAYSLINWILMYPVVAYVASATSSPVWVYLTSVLAALGSPVLLALTWYFIRSKRIATRWLDHPIPTAWDYIFHRRRPYLVRLYLKSGEVVAGYYGADPYSTAFPREPELYCERACRVGDDGEIIDWVPQSGGLLVRLAECKAIEFFDVVSDQESDDD